MRPIELYQQAVLSGKYQPDQAQKKIILFLDQVYQELHQTLKQTNFSLINPLINLFKINLSKKNKTQKNLYLWGSVGSGKTSLMDIFFESLDHLFEKTAYHKQRLHFHDFMQMIHEKLNDYQGEREPLKKIAKHYFKKNQIKIICLDEFFVNDIGDAMILGNLLQALFDEKILLITTSNAHPDDLYKNGLQRTAFLKTIELIKQRMTVLNLSHATDYRLSDLYFQKYSQKQNSQKQMQKKIEHIKNIFIQLALGKIFYHQNIIINHRPLTVQAYADNIIWFDFKTICHIPRNTKDYLIIAQRWKIMILDNLSVIDEQESNIARCFINLIDIVYDAKIKLILNFHPNYAHIKNFHGIYPYPNGELAFQFQRTCSRLIELELQANFCQGTGI